MLVCKMQDVGLLTICDIEASWESEPTLLSCERGASLVRLRACDRFMRAHREEYRYYMKIEMWLHGEGHSLITCI